MARRILANLDGVGHNLRRANRRAYRRLFALRSRISPNYWPSPVTRSRPVQQIPLADVLAFTVHVLNPAT